MFIAVTGGDTLGSITIEGNDSYIKNQLDRIIYILGFAKKGDTVTLKLSPNGTKFGTGSFAFYEFKEE